MVIRDLTNINMDKIKGHFKPDDLFNDYLFIFRKKMIFIHKYRKLYKLCANYPMSDYLYLDSNFYVCRVSDDISVIVSAFLEEVQKLTLEIVPF